MIFKNTAPLPLLRMPRRACPALPPRRSAWEGRVTTGALAAALAACGGGGDSGSVVSGTGMPPPQTIPAVMSVPDPVGYDADHLAAFNRLNAIRLSAGLGMVAQNTYLDQAAQNHVGWMIANDTFSHEEVPGTPGFTGETAARRSQVLGYVPQGWDEIMSIEYDAAKGVDFLTNLYYHRQAALAFDIKQVGVGWTRQGTTTIFETLVLDLDQGEGPVQTAQPFTQGIVVWPLDGATNVSPTMGSEMPDPVPSIPSNLLGTPASVSVDYWKQISVSRFDLSVATTGEVVDCTLRTRANDPLQMTPGNFVGLIPNATLAPNTTYLVAFEGLIDGTPITRTWHFTTGKDSYY